MPTFADWFARSPLASAGRVFIAVVLTLAVTQWVTNGSIDFAAWQTWVIAALASRERSDFQGAAVRQRLPWSLAASCTHCHAQIVALCRCCFAPPPPLRAPTTNLR